METVFFSDLINKKDTRCAANLTRSTIATSFSWLGARMFFFLKVVPGRYKGNTFKTARLGVPSGLVGVLVHTSPASFFLGLA